MTRVLVIDNYDSFVYTLNGYLQQLGADTTVVRNDELTVGELEQMLADYDGVLAVKSARLVSRKSDGAPCGAMNIEATYGNGSLTGAYWFGNSARTTVEFPLK